MPNRYVGSTLSVLTALGVAACGNVTAGGLTGEATVVVSGDADTLSLALRLPTPSLTPAASSVAPLLSPEDEAEGEVEVEFLAFIVTEAGGVLQLGNEEIRVRVDLRGRDEMDVIDRQLIPATRYTELRLVFTEISAEVQNLVVNGVPVTEVHVELEDLSLLVTRPLDLDVTPGSLAELVVDLNTLAWLAAVDPTTGAVDETVFQSLVNVVVR
jgi:hypothetical protein